MIVKSAKSRMGGVVVTVPRGSCVFAPTVPPPKTSAKVCTFSYFSHTELLYKDVSSFNNFYFHFSIV